MKISKRSRWIILLLALILSLIGVLMQFGAVKATFTDVHAAMVLIRFETEIMQKTPAGQYYESLFWKHNDELIEIASKYPEHRVDFSNVTRKFIPELEALLDGEGDSVYITREHIESLKSELAWFASMGSPALQEDIQRELQRFPLDQFVGMTMTEAQNLVNLGWTSTPLIEKSLVPGSNGAWADHIFNGVYFEYPSGYNLQLSGFEENYIYLIPSASLPYYWNPCIVKVSMWNVPPDQKDQLNPRSWYAPERILWENQITNAEFPGINLATVNPDYPVSYIYAFQYNEVNQVAIRMSVFVYQNSNVPDSLAHPQVMNVQYEYLQHMMDSLRME